MSADGTPLVFAMGGRWAPKSFYRGVIPRLRWGDIRKRLCVASLALALAAGQAFAAGMTIHVGELGVLADAPFYIALDQGYFAKADVDVTLDRFDSSAQGLPALAKNQIQVLGGAVSASLVDGISRGWPVEIAMGRAQDLPGFSSDSIVVRRQLQDAIKTVGDLRGKRIGLNVPNSSHQYILAKALEDAGLNAADVHIVYMPWSNMAPALASGALDAAVIVEPFATKFIDREIAAPFLRASDIFRDPPLVASVILYNKDWNTTNADEAVRFTTAYLHGARDYVDAMHGGPKRDAVIKSIIAHTINKDRSDYDRVQWSYIDPNGTLSLQSLLNQQAWYAKEGMLSGPVDMTKAIDMRVRDQALGRLGRVEVR